MSHAVRILLALLLASGSLLTLAGAPPSLGRVANRQLNACAARPVPLPVDRPVNPALVAAVQERVTNWRESRHTRYPGISTAIRWDDGRLITAVSGVADSNSGRKLTEGTPFALASVSKPFTAALALLLDACGLMPLTTRAASLVPNADVHPEATIEDLLRHEGGMSDWLTDKYTRMDWLIAHPNGKVGPTTAVQNLLPRGKIGDFSYSNSSFTLVTLAAEKATGVGWRELMQRLILDPLDLTETRFGPVADASRTHHWSGGRMRPFGQPGWGPTRSAASVLRGAGDLFSTPRDLVRFGELLWGDRLLEGSQTNLINGIANLTGFSWSYTIGSMMARSWLGTLRTYGHNGGFSGASSTLRRIPELGVTISVIANGMGTPGNYANDLAINLVGLLDVPAPSSAQAIANATGAGLRAALRADPEPFPAETAPRFDVCGEPLATGTGERWIDLNSGESGDWSGSVTAMAELPNGTLLVAGRGLTRAGGVAVQGVAKRSPITGQWTPLSLFLRANGTVADIYAMSVDLARSRLYVGGDFTTIGSGLQRVRALGLAQLNLKSGRWSAIDGGIKGRSPMVRALALDDASGALAVAGRFASAGGKTSPLVALWAPGSGWRAINSPSGAQVEGTPEAVTLSSTGTVSLSGHLSLAGAAAYIARWTPETKTWRALATSTTIGDAPRALALDTDGALIAGTGVSWYGTSLLRESALSGYGWARLGVGVSNPRKATWISALATTPAGETIIGGTFTLAGTSPANRIARWNPSTGSLTPIGVGLSIEPDAITSSASVLAYAATRLRGQPGDAGRLCISAWGSPALTSSPVPSITSLRRALKVAWVNSATPGVAGWIAVAQSPSGKRFTCTAAAIKSSCTITGLTPNTKYRVSLRAYSVPAGPAPESTKVTATTKR